MPLSPYCARSSRINSMPLRFGEADVADEEVAAVGRRQVAGLPRGAGGVDGVPVAAQQTGDCRKAVLVVVRHEDAE